MPGTDARTVVEGAILGLAPGQPASVVIGADERAVECSGVVQSAGTDTVSLRLTVLPFDPDLLSPGADVRLIWQGGEIRDAWMVAVTPGAEPVLELSLPPMGALDGDNRRSFHRVPMRLREVPATLVANGSAARFRVRMVDLSGGGVRILSPRPMEPGNVVGLRVPITQRGASIEVHGRVVWVRAVHRAWQAGIEFRNIAEKDRDLIIRTVFLEEVRWRRV